MLGDKIRDQATEFQLCKYGKILLMIYPACVFLVGETYLKNSWLAVEE